ncbi:BolA/IbaG family iron-sulfur metabolism protein [Buchnera aphidicola (Takecallis taiwana)]|uniref:BolA/IbaG family iron-sulfur metabolism protein n=1 Tax=Buchnera aphidicola TaxID=9 RepID=UPI0031B6A4C4
MNNNNIKLHIKKHVQLDKIYLKGDQNHIHIIAIGNIFNGLKQISRQKLIYQPLTTYIINKKIHAVTIDTFTPTEWEKENIYVNDYS